MITRLRVDGFKNLAGVDVSFGPFTCIAGPNGVGKSNLFDAITFLSALSEKPLLEAAMSVRDEAGRSGDVRSLFHRIGNTYEDTMSFEVEMLVPREAIDEFGQAAQATITFLRYRITLRYREGAMAGSVGGLEIIEESLTHITKGDARKHLGFNPNKAWRESAVTGQSTGHRTAAFISTEPGEPAKVKIHQDGGSRGQPRTYPAADLPRTVLSGATNAAESPTATVARREMQSWRLLQLEPSALRRPSRFADPGKLGADGSNLASTLYHLARTGGLGSRHRGEASEAASAQVYATVANRLSELIHDVREVRVDRDERRELLTLQVTGRDGTTHAARALSDGALRFLALAVLDADPEATGVICLEEPENGIHPARIPAMLELLQSIATDPEEPTGPDNPLRQVIVNTHSPIVVGAASADDLLYADLRETVDASGRRYGRLAFSCHSDSWRATCGDTPAVTKGEILAYLNPACFQFGSAQDIHRSRAEPSGRRVAEHPDSQLPLPFSAGGMA